MAAGKTSTADRHSIRDGVSTRCRCGKSPGVAVIRIFAVFSLASVSADSLIEWRDDDFFVRARVRCIIFRLWDY